MGISEERYPARDIRDINDAVIPCIFPCCREFSTEKGSLETGSSARKAKGPHMEALLLFC